MYSRDLVLHNLNINYICHKQVHIPIFFTIHMVMLIDQEEGIGELDDYGAEEWERYEALHDDVDKQVNFHCTIKLYCVLCFHVVTAGLVTLLLFALV